MFAESISKSQILHNAHVFVLHMEVRLGGCCLSVCSEKAEGHAAVWVTEMALGPVISLLCKQRLKPSQYNRETGGKRGRDGGRQERPLRIPGPRPVLMEESTGARSACTGSRPGLRTTPLVQSKPAPPGQETVLSRLPG